MGYEVPSIGAAVDDWARPLRFPAVRARGSPGKKRKSLPAGRGGRPRSRLVPVTRSRQPRRVDLNLAGRFLLGNIHMSRPWCFENLELESTPSQGLGLFDRVAGGLLYIAGRPAGGDLQLPTPLQAPIHILHLSSLSKEWPPTRHEVRVTGAILRLGREKQEAIRHEFQIGSHWLWSGYRIRSFGLS